MVQLAPPTAWSAAVPVALKARTYLREYDQKTGLVGKVIEQSVSDWAEHSIGAVEMSQYPKEVQSIEDLGNGDVLVNLYGRFLSGTYVRVGGRRIADGAGMSFEADRIRFIASRLELAARDVRIVSRDGTETKIEVDGCSPAIEPPAPKLSLLGDNDARVEISFAKDHGAGPLRVFTLLAGESAYRIEKVDGKTLRADVPIAVLKTKPPVSVRALLQPKGCAAAVTMPDKLPSKPKSLELVTVTRSASEARFVLQGPEADKTEIVFPAGLSFIVVGGNKTLTLEATLANSLQSIVVKTGDSSPAVLAVPQPPKPEPPKCCLAATAAAPAQP
jgi:hypothetical protein